MRVLLMVLVACSVEYQAEPLCHADGEYTICQQALSRYDAEEFCKNYGKIVEIDDHEEQEKIASLGSFWLGDLWWGSHPSSIWFEECPAMSKFGSTSPHTCTDELPFICEL